MKKSNNQVKPHKFELDDGGIERSKYVYELVNGWIENADNKVGVSCGMFTGVFGVVTFLAEHYIKVPKNPVINECWRCVYRGSFVMSLIIMAVAICAYAKAIIPNLKSSGNKKPSEKKCPIYYGDIHSLRYEEYLKVMKTATKEDFFEEVLLESWYNSGICMRKMNCYKAGVIASIAAIIFAFMSFGAHFLMFR